MADPKSKVQETIELLQGMVEILDRDIEIVEKNALKANKLNDAIAKGEQAGAVGRINTQIAQIDDIILNDADISALIGATQGEGTKELNDAIKAVTEAVKRVKAWEFKDRSGKAVDIGIKTDDVNTDIVVDEVDKIEKINEDVDYDKVGDKVAEMESKIALEELYQKYTATQAALGKEEVDVNYEKFIKEFKAKLEKYKALGTLKDFSTDNLVMGKHKFKKNETSVNEFLKVLKAAKGAKTITITGFNGSKPIAIDKITYENLAKTNSNSVIQNAMAALVAEAKVQDSDFDAKTAEMSTLLRDNKTMQLLFTEDRDALKTILDKKPVNVAEIDAILDEMSRPDGKNNQVFEDMEDYKSIGDIEALKRELAKLKEVHGYIEAESAAKAVKYEAKEITEIDIGGQKIALKKNSYDRNFVDIKKKSELDDVMEATYGGLEESTRNALVEKVEKEASETGNKLPGKLWSGLMSFITFGAYNPRRTAIEARVKGLLSAGIISTRDSSIDKARGKQEIADEKAAEATAEREKMTDFDRSLRVTENDLAREQMRQEIIAGRGKVSAEKARKGLNLDQINEDAKKKLEDEGR